MQRICNSLASNGYDVLLVGRNADKKANPANQNFQIKRLNCIITKGLFYYLEFNTRLFLFLLSTKADCYCAIDLDTILPVYFVSIFKGKKKVYDAHELFTEQKEIVTRKNIHRFWMAVEKFALPKFQHGYTVNDFIKEEFERRYKVKYEVIRNLPLKNIQYSISNNQYSNFIIYQGGVNEGRCFETLIPAMKHINCKLVICGEGNFYEQTKQLINENNVEKKIELQGYVSPNELKLLTPQALLGLTLFENKGLNQYYSLSNRFFDYIMAGIPQVCVNYPEYKKINDEFEIAYLIDDTSETTLMNAITVLIDDKILYNKLQQNCIKAREILNWNNEEKKLINFWKNICI
jgi:glycosyltransferase involved in cell wall biosynthesis